MAINNYPGVGPQNSDIAAAVAAPSAATIAAAVAAPSAATIAAAVAAPSSATIASAVAAAVPTLSQINTSVATNAPSAYAWTVISSFTANNTVTSYTWSSLSGYKAYKIVYYLTASSGRVSLRFNGDAASNYYTTYQNNSSGGVNGDTINDTAINNINAAGTPMIGSYVIPHATLATYKDVYSSLNGVGGVGSRSAWATGIWANGSAITSITALNPGATNFTGGIITLLGAN